MTHLSDISIKTMVADGTLGIDPFDVTFVQPASFDCRLGQDFVRMIQSDDPIDPLRDDTVRWERLTLPSGEPVMLQPGDFMLGHTFERYRLPANILARVEGKSSLGRLGLLVHVTAGFIDPGFEGQIVLEFANVGARSILLRPGMKIAQMSYAWLDQPAERPYGTPGLNSKYHGQSGARVGSYNRNYRDGMFGNSAA